MLRGSYFLVNLGPLGRLGPLGQIYGTNLSSKLQSLKGPNRLKGPKGPLFLRAANKLKIHVEKNRNT